MLEESINDLTKAIHRLCDQMAGQETSGITPSPVIPSPDAGQPTTKTTGRKTKAKTEAAPPTTPSETPNEPAYTIEDMRRVMQDLSAKYGPDCVVNGLARLGCTKISEVAHTDYPKLLDAFKAEAEARSQASTPADPLA